MSTITVRAAAVKSDPLVLSAEAVQERRARWLLPRPWSCEYDAVRDGGARWLADAPRDLSAACCPEAAAATPCRSCDPSGYGPPPTSFSLADDSGDQPAEMSDTFRREYQRAVVREMAGLEFAPDPDDEDTDPSVLRDDEMPGEYPTFTPTADDLAWYREQCREYELRIWRDRIEADVPAADQGFRAVLAGDSDLYRESSNPHRRWIGEVMGKLYDIAVSLEAKDGEQMMDRLDAVIDSMAPEARRVPWAATAMAMGW